MKKSITASVLVAWASGCAFADSGYDGLGEVARAEQAVTVTSGRTVPYPIVRTLDEDSALVAPIDPTTNKPRVAWDASYMEMLVADELGKCVAEVSGTAPPPDVGGMYLHAGFGLPGMERILTAIGNGTCWRSEYGLEDPEYPPAALEWALRRSDPLCNADADGKPIAAIELPDRDDNSLIADFMLQHDPDNVDHYPSSPLRGFTCAPSTTRTCSIGPAYGWIFQAEMGLCLAQRLNGLLEGAEIFTATSQEHLLALGLAHESAQASMMKFGYLLKLQQKPNADIPMNNFAGEATGAYLRLWMDGSAGAVAKIRSDFLRALRLTSVGATSLASYLQRQSGARWTTSIEAGPFGRDWGIGSARHRLLNLVYGGGALDDLWGIALDAGGQTPWFSEVKEASADPKLGVMFNLARQGDGLFFHPLAVGSSVTLDPASWESMYVEAELGQRQRDCLSTAPGSCTKDALRAQLPPLSNLSAYTINQLFGLTLEHARKLATSLFDAAVRPDLVDHDRWLPTVHGTFHLSGVHTATTPAGHVGETGWIKLDPDTMLYNYGHEDRAQDGLGVCAPATPGWNVVAACPYNRAPGWSEEPHGLLGVVPALAFAREVLFEQGSAMATGELTANAASAVAEIERLAGKTTAVRRAGSIDLLTSNAPGQLPTLVNPALGGVSPGLKSAAKDQTFQAPNGIGRAALNAAPSMSGTPTGGSGIAAGLTRVAWVAPNGSPFWPGASSLLVRQSDGSYLFVSQTRHAPPDNYLEPISTVTDGGWFASLVAKVSSVAMRDWSRPEFDGFGLPTTWVPPADASLMGGNAGEESYQYLLRSAKGAAEEATTAVKTAIDKLAEEARDSAALAHAESKARGISALEREALCGSIASCEVPMVEFDFQGQLDSSTCAGLSSPGIEACLAGVSQYSARLHRTLIPQQVAAALDSNSASFDGSQSTGSELQRVLHRIWNAARLVVEARDQGSFLSRAMGREAAASEAASNAAAAAHTLAEAQLVQLQTDYAYAIGRIQGEIDDANNVRRNAKYRFANFCQLIGVPAGTRDAQKWCARHASCQRRGIKLGEGDTSAGARSRCTEAYIAYKDALERCENLIKKTSQDIRELPPGQVTESQLNLIAATREQAGAQLEAANLQDAARGQQAWVQVGAHLAVLQQALGELGAALVELSQLKQKAGQVRVRADLEASTIVASANTNAVIRRQFRSYDLWRARALLESARRIAATARRSIEARFVVDLSTLDSEQAFVASPSTWADEIYESDLNAPEAVGLSQAPKTPGAIYPNKLIDYVGNLERFVQGYTITYPTSVSLPDSEVLSFGGPDQRVPARDAGLASLSPNSAGWRFYCEGLNTWIAHPGMGDYGVVDALDTACDGRRPLLAKLGFALDPWGTLNGSWSRIQFVDRHNVRWRRLAVNLVGTGIRDCSRATDSMSCYTNPYVRFNLIHVGPSWQTSHSGEWRALDIPTAHIESGKALAAEEWLEPISNSWNMPYVANVARGELFGRPAAGEYELVFEVTPDIRLDRIERVQLLVEQDYWVKQTGGRGVYNNPTPTAPNGTAGATGAGGAPGSGGTSGLGGGSSSGGTTASGGSGSGGGSGGGLTGYCTPVGNDPRIEDFEDGNQILATYEQRLGRWYGFRAGTCSAVPATNDSFAPLAPTVANGSSFVGHTSGTGCTITGTDGWSGGGIGFTFLASTLNGFDTICANYDATKYAGIAFDLYGSGQVRLEICMSDNIEGNNPDCNGANFTANSTWTRHAVNWSGLSQRGFRPIIPFSAARIRKIQFLTDTADYSFAVDNLSFVSN